MKNFILIIFLLSFSTIFAQQAVTLRTGEKYTGEILLQNADFLVLQTSDGQRFQFPAANILKIENINTSQTTINQTFKDSASTIDRKNNIFCLVELSGGGIVAKHKFELSPSGAVSLAFGTRRIANKPVFAGIGASIMPVFADKENLLFLPIFARIKSNSESHRLAPFALLDAGYAFSLSDKYKGGIFAKTAAGIQIPVSADNIFYLGIYASITEIYGALTEIKDNISYNYKGNSNIFGFGINTGIQF
ncbi:MAG: hypothetical protein LBV75_08590 [Paludibacter sp.]|nr:hypothetical protein [Paludibacter sp.]